MKSKTLTILIVVIECIALFMICDLLIGSFVRLPGNELIRVEDNHYHHGFIPDICGKQVWGQQKYEVCTNSLGLVDEARKQINLLASTKKRILVIGDSFVEGIGFEFNKTFPGILKNSVDSDKIEILNAGVTSYSPHLYYLKVKYLIDIGLQFESVFVFIDISDPQDEIVYENYHPVEMAGVPPSSTFQPPYNRVRFFLKSHSLVFREITHLLWPLDPIIVYFWKDIHNYYRVRGGWVYDDAEFDRWGRRGLELCGQWMDNLYRLCVQHEITLNIVVYPWPEQIRMHDLNSRQVTFWKHFSEARNLSFTDFFPQFIDDHSDPETTIQKFFISSDVHWNEEGHRMIAQKLLNDFPGVFGY